MSLIIKKTLSLLPYTARDRLVTRSINKESSRGQITKS